MLPFESAGRTHDLEPENEMTKVITRGRRSSGRYRPPGRPGKPGTHVIVDAFDVGP